MSNLVFTESSDDAVWDFEDDATRWVDNCPDLTHAEEMEGAVRGYRAGAAASEARIKELEAALHRLVNASEPVEEYTHEVAVELEEAIKTAELVLKEADQ